MDSSSSTDKLAEIAWKKNAMQDRLNLNSKQNNTDPKLQTKTYPHILQILLKIS